MSSKKQIRSEEDIMVENLKGSTETLNSESFRTLFRAESATNESETTTLSAVVDAVTEDNAEVTGADIVSILNAWRHERNFSQKLEQDQMDANEKARSLKRQATTLFHLWHCEQNRLLTANKKVKKLRGVLEKSIQERKKIIAEKEELEKTVNRLEKDITGLVAGNEELAHSVETTKKHCDFLEVQLTEERMCLTKLRSEKFALYEKVMELELSIANKDTEYQNLEITTAELKEKLREQVERLAEAEIQNQKLVAESEEYCRASDTYNELRERELHKLRSELTEKNKLLMMLGNELMLLEQAIKDKQQEIEKKDQEIVDLTAARARSMSSIWSSTWRLLSNNFAILPRNVINFLFSRWTNVRYLDNSPDDELRVIDLE